MSNRSTLDEVRRMASALYPHIAIPDQKYIDNKHKLRMKCSLCGEPFEKIPHELKRSHDRGGNAHRCNKGKKFEKDNSTALAKAYENRKKKAKEDILEICDKYNLTVFNIDKYNVSSDKNLQFECGNKHPFVDSLDNIGKRIKINPKNICAYCVGKTPPRTLDQIYNDTCERCLLQGLVVVTTIEDFRGRKSNVDIECVKNSKHLQKNVLVESINFRSGGCSQCKYGKHKGRLGIPCGNEKCNNACLKCKVYSGILYIKHCLSNHSHFDKTTTVNFTWTVKQFEKQSGKCYYSKRVIDPTGKDRMHAISIDRLDNSKGHTYNNCVLVILPVNLCKNHMNHSIFINWLKWVKAQTPVPRNTIDQSEIDIIRKKINTMGRISKLGERHIIKSVSEDDLINMCIVAGNRCAITGINLRWVLQKQYDAGSFDRINSDGHYEISNIQPVLLYINYMKSHFMTNTQCKIVVQSLLENV
jgi:hypothetical protein